MAALTPQDIGHFRERLEAERHAIESRIAARNRDIQENVQEESGVGDSGDESLRIYDREDETDANELDMQTLEQVNRAIDRIKAGTYGLSEVSGKPIDGIFSVAMTLLVLNIVIPSSQAVAHAQQPIWASGALASEATVWNALLPLGPHLLTYLMSFLTLGIFWAGQQTQLNYFSRSDHRLTWIHLVFLLAVVFMPFSTALLAQFISFRLPMLIYWLNLFSLGLLLFISLEYASRAGLLSADATKEFVAAGRRRIMVYQLLYAAASLLCVFNTYLAIAVLVLLQLNSVIVPRIGPLNRF